MRFAARLDPALPIIGALRVEDLNICATQRIWQVRKIKHQYCPPIAVTA